MRRSGVLVLVFLCVWAATFGITLSVVVMTGTLQGCENAQANITGGPWGCQAIFAAFIAPFTGIMSALFVSYPYTPPADTATREGQR